MGTFFIECIIIFIYYDFFLFDIIFLYYYFLSILTLFCDLCIAHTDFLFSYILYILIESIDNCCWYMVYREDFFHTYFFMILPLFFICLHFSSIHFQAQPIPPELTAKLLGNRVAVSPIVTVEPRRRKFHKPITLTIPVPQAAGKGMINQYNGETPTLRLLCSITGMRKYQYPGLC